MEHNNLIKKRVVVSVILLLIGVSCIPSGITSKVAPKDDIRNEPQDFFFGLKGHIKFDYNKSLFLEPIKPVSAGGIFPFNVSYKVSGRFANIITRWFQGRTSMTIELSIKEIPEWAGIIVSHDTVHCYISTDWERCIERPYIQITLDERAPAFELTYYKIVGASDSKKGPFGFLTWIHGSEGKEELPFVPDYMPILSITPEGNYIQIPPGQIGELNITIENLANGLTLVKSEVIDIPSPDWWVYIQPETVLNVGEEKKVSLFIMPTENFTGTAQIKISFTPCYYYNPEIQGDPQIEYFTVHSQP
ncbi:MAG: hypothetical protein JSW06_08385 [Thermoplasmatales archaeon]|nr:MAG: hypothetical protein JSW06_08385 [Thermoplasmatales archaeon]